MAEADLRVTRARKAASAFAAYAGRATADVPSRDVATLRFMLAFEATWKAAQAALRERGLEATSPRAAIRGSRDEGWLDDADADDAGEMLADRNLAVHTYNEDLAADLATRLPRWSALIGRWVAAMGEAE